MRRVGRYGVLRLYGRTKSLRVSVLCVLAIGGLSLALAPVANASPTPFTWAGGSTITEDWSAPANWEGDAAPTAGTEIETLTFPRLTSTVCTDKLGTEPCYISF